MPTRKRHDVLTPEQRRYCMSKIKGKNTKPELTIRKELFKKGFRYKIHDSTLPGRPDMVFPMYNSIVFVHGCFWHGHGCHLFKWPATRAEFWRRKIIRNQEIDRKTKRKLQGDGWYILIIWECAIKGKQKRNIDDVIHKLCDWLKFGVSCKSIKGKI
jgi:DNA mismatch endonuclease (patch repair protein)